MRALLLRSSVRKEAIPWATKLWICPSAGFGLISFILSLQLPHSPPSLLFYFY